MLFVCFQILSTSYGCENFFVNFFCIIRHFHELLFILFIVCKIDLCVLRLGVNSCFCVSDES